MSCLRTIRDHRLRRTVDVAEPLSQGEEITLRAQLVPIGFAPIRANAPASCRPAAPWSRVRATAGPRSRAGAGA